MKMKRGLLLIVVFLVSSVAMAQNATYQGPVANEPINLMVHEQLTKTVDEFVKTRFPGYIVDTDSPRREVVGEDKKTKGIFWHYKGKKPFQILVVGLTLESKAFMWTLYNKEKGDQAVTRGVASLSLK